MLLRAEIVKKAEAISKSVVRWVVMAYTAEECPTEMQANVQAMSFVPARRSGILQERLFFHANQDGR